MSAPTIEQIVQVDPTTMVIGENVRTDTHPDAKEFAASIKARGVLEPVTAHRAEDDTLVVLRGQRRTLVAAQVGTPTGTVPVWIVPAPDDADRIVDQLSENLHRAAMSEREVRDGIEQLALCGVSPAQIAKRAALKRVTVNAALTVAGNASTRARMDADGLTLDEAAIFAEFEHDEEAIERLTTALRYREPLPHVAQRLRDDAAEAAALAVEIERLRAEGLPVLDPHDVPSNLWRIALADLRDGDGQPVPSETWPNVPGAGVVVVQDWEFPDSTDADEDASADNADDEPDRAEAVRVYHLRWICTDPAAAGLRHRYDTSDSSGRDDEPDEAHQEAQREAQRAERRMVREQNSAWRSAQTVRRDWLAAFLRRKSAPKDAEALICAALLSGQHSLAKAMQEGHSMMCRLLGVEAPAGYYGTRAACTDLASAVSTPKAATMLALASVLAAWEDCTGVHTWRSPSGWDAQVMTTLTTWGYPAAEVEALLITAHASDQTDQGEAEAEAAA